jgi:Zn-dependent protease
MSIESIIQSITVFAIPLILGITLHEAAHAFAAKYYGDSTAYMLGRMTLNPIKHIDPVWTILVPIVMLLLSNFQFAFGGAKPVPVNTHALRNPKRDMALVAAAGPAANLIMLIMWAVFAKIVVTTVPPSEAGQFLVQVAQAGMLVNALLMIFNLFPLLPLDGGRILVGFLPNQLAIAYSRLEPYGMIILVALILTGVVNKLLGPLLRGTLNAVYSVLGLG